MLPDAGRFVNAEAARVAHDREWVDRFVAGCFETDPLADRLLEHFRSLPGGEGWRLLDRALAAGIPPGAPAELRELLEPLLNAPDWVDFDEVDRGAVAFFHAGPAMVILSLLCGSLAYGYQSASLSRPLVRTGRLERMAARRIAETTQWGLDALAPGRLLPGGGGLAAVVRLRMVHAAVRAHLLPDWDVDAWGVPANATDSWATGFAGFVVMPIRAQRDLGVRFSERELDAIVAQWRWIGYGLGIPEDMLPWSFEETEALTELLLALDEGPNEDGPRLMRALLYHGLPVDRLLPGPATGPARAVAAAVLGAFTRRWMGDEMADRLGVPATPLTRLVPLVRPLSAAHDLVRASRLLGPPEKMATAEIALGRRILGAAGMARRPVSPADTAGRTVASRPAAAPLPAAGTARSCAARPGAGPSTGTRARSGSAR